MLARELCAPFLMTVLYVSRFWPIKQRHRHIDGFIYPMLVYGSVRHSSKNV